MLQNCISPKIAEMGLGGKLEFAPRKVGGFLGGKSDFAPYTLREGILAALRQAQGPKVAVVK